MRKKLFTFLLILAASIVPLFAESGTCGLNLTWNLADSVLTISGTGAMTDYNSRSSLAPWYSNRLSIKTVIINDGVKSIGNNALYKCTSLTSVTIPNSVTSIGEYAFYDCTGLASVTIGNSVTSIGSYAFSECSALTSVTIPNSVTSIGDGAFSSCSGLTSVTIPNSVTSIRESAFDRCSSLISVTIPNSVTSIGSRAFYCCSGLTSVTIPNSVTSIGKSAFYGCSSLTSVHISDIAAWCKIEFVDDSANPFFYANNLYLNGEHITALVIPNSVTSISDYAFYGCSSLISVTIPNSITSIGYRTFEGCNLNAVYISDLTKWCNISFSSVVLWKADLYLNNELVTDLIVPDGITTIGSYVFAGCTSIISATIPNSVVSIGKHAFFGCALNSIEIPNSVRNIGNYAFYGCRGLNSIEIPNSVKSIGEYAFWQCSSLSTVIIPNSVTSIGERAFWDCSSLTSVTIGNSVTSIGGGAFGDCWRLKSVYPLSTTPPTIESSTFKTINSDAIVYLTFGTGQLGTYAIAEYWKELDLYPHITQYQNVSATSYKATFDIEDITLQSCGIEGGEQEAGNTLEYIGLEPESEYKDIPVVMTSNTGETETVNVSFTTTALELTTKASKPVSSTTAILLAETNMSDAEVSCGFEYKRNDAPADMEGNKVFCPVANGQMAGRLKNLKDDVYYKYRAFYQSAAGNMYYGDWQYIFTGDVAVEFDPILYTYGAMVVRENEATISGYALAGSEDFTEQGFEYWAESRTNSGANAPRRMPAALGEHFFVQASGIALRATLTNLDAGTVYKYRVYGKVGDQYYYGSEQAFTTTGTYTPPTYTITFANWDGATLQSSQVEEGILPEYTGATPERPEDEQYTYTFNGWSPAIVAATADATYTAQYISKDKHEGIGEIPSDQVQCTKVLIDNHLYILQGAHIFDAQGKKVK